MIEPSPCVSAFNTTEETISRPPEVVWTQFLDRSRWMPTFVSRDLVSGVDGAVGTVARVRSRFEGRDLERFEENVFVVPARRLVVRMWSVGVPMLGHGDFRFDPTERGCRLTVSIHSFLPTAEAMDVTMLSDVTQTRITEDFARLRSLLEAEATTA